jgi:hypothetical protein
MNMFTSPQRELMHRLEEVRNELKDINVVLHEGTDDDGKSAAIAVNKLLIVIQGYEKPFNVGMTFEQVDIAFDAAINFNPKLDSVNLRDDIISYEPSLLEMVDHYYSHPLVEDRQDELSDEFEDKVRDELTRLQHELTNPQPEFVEDDNKMDQPSNVDVVNTEIHHPIYDSIIRYTVPMKWYEWLIPGRYDDKEVKAVMEWFDEHRPFLLVLPFAQYRSVDDILVERKAYSRRINRC